MTCTSVLSSLTAVTPARLTPPSTSRDHAMRRARDHVALIYRQLR